MNHIDTTCKISLFQKKHINTNKIRNWILCEQCLLHTKFHLIPKLVFEVDWESFQRWLQAGHKNILTSWILTVETYQAVTYSFIDKPTNTAMTAFILTTWYQRISKIFRIVQNLCKYLVLHAEKWEADSDLNATVTLFKKSLHQFSDVAREVLGTPN